MSPAALAVMARPKTARSSGAPLRYPHRPSGSLSSIDGRPVRTEWAKSSNDRSITGKPIIWGKARIDIGWSLRSSRDAALCWYPSPASENTPCAASRRSTLSNPSGSTCASPRQFLRRDGTVVDVVGDAEIRHHVQAPGGHARVGDREDQLVRLHRTLTRPGRVPGCGRPTRRTRAATG